MPKRRAVCLDVELISKTVLHTLIHIALHFLTHGLAPDAMSMDVQQARIIDRLIATRSFLLWDTNVELINTVQSLYSVHKPL